MILYEEFRKQVDYDLVGVPPLTCFDVLPENQHPLSIFPDGKSVVVLGKRIRRGDFRTMEEGSIWNTPTSWLSDFDDVIRLIENRGYECIPYTPSDAAQLPNRPVRKNQCTPNSVRLSLEFAAACAGLGELGYHGMFMTEQYGIRQRLGLLITDMEIEPGPLSATSICDRCMECAKACPLEAISTIEKRQIACNDRMMTIGNINGEACRNCPNGVGSNSSFFAGAEELPELGTENTNFNSPGHLPSRLAAACGRACIAHFEILHDSGFHIPFRVREPWGFRPDAERDWEKC